MKRQFNKQVFIVDDDPFWTAVLTQILTDIGFTNIRCFSNGTDCINNLSLNPNLVFLDYQMDDMDGIKVLQKIKAYNTEILVVFCTDHNVLRVAVNAMKNGSHDYILKSTSNGQALADNIKTFIDNLVFSEKVF